MRFSFIDQITELAPNKRIVTSKSLSGDEDYLSDHFPLFPVMPGVLMLEAITQAASWLVRKSIDFRSNDVVLREARNVKYAEFVRPGQTLTVQVDWVKENEGTYKLKAQAMVDDTSAVKAHLLVKSVERTDENPVERQLEDIRKQRFEAEFDRLYRPQS